MLFTRVSMPTFMEESNPNFPRDKIKYMTNKNINYAIKYFLRVQNFD